GGPRAAGAARPRRARDPRRRPGPRGRRRRARGRGDGGFLQHGEGRVPGRRPRDPPEAPSPGPRRPGPGDHRPLGHAARRAPRSRGTPAAALSAARFSETASRGPPRTIRRRYDPAASAPDASPSRSLAALATILATGFGSGYAPVAPGTAGSAVGLLLFWPLHAVDVTGQVAATVALFFAGTAAATQVAERVGKKDPG